MIRAKGERSERRRRLASGLGIALALLTLVALPRKALAHTLGMSRSEFVLEASGTVRALVVLAKPDAMRLGQMDTDGDGRISSAELAASEATFRDVLVRGIVVRADGRACPGKLEGGGDVEEDGFGLSMTFACPTDTARLDVNLPFLAKLGDEHRDLARLGARGASAERLLRRTDASIALAAPGTPPNPEAAEAPPEARSIFGQAFSLGFVHVLGGWDHLLFIAALLVGTRGLRAIALAVSAFTVAHSLTLAVAALGLWAPSPRWIEPLIAASIAWVAFENVLVPRPAHRWRITFLFGLVHGFAFAGALRELSIAKASLVPTLFGFNLGVEAGQLAAVAVALPIILRLRRNEPANATSATARWARAASLGVGVVGAALVVVRLVRP